MSHLSIKDLSVKREYFLLYVEELNLPKGMIIGLVGRNGAGKTTLIETLAYGLPYEGSITYENMDYLTQAKTIKSKLGFVFDHSLINIEFKIEKILKLFQKIYPSFSLELFDQYAQRLHLPAYHRKLKSLSIGQLKKVNLALTMSLQPEFLILDEVTANIDPVDRQEILDLLQEYMLDENHTILFSTHITSDLEKIADYVIFIDGGDILLTTDINQLQEDYCIIPCDPTIEAHTEPYIIAKHEYGQHYEALIKQKDFHHFASIPYRSPSIDEMLYYLTKGRG